jgi:hypothetical protein
VFKLSLNPFLEASVTHRRVLSILLAALVIACVPSVLAAQSGNIKHVLLISVDGMHALDVANYVQNNPGSALAELASHGITYTNARTPQNSDSFPGLLALITGGSPLSHGLFYDASYDRAVFAPSNITCSGGAGNTMTFDESIDLYVNGVSQNVIDPTQLPRVRDKFGNCVALYPHSAVRTNTIFEVAKSKGWRTAWEDKHPAYDIVNGPSGAGVDDLYTPEITNVGGLDNTHSVVCTVGNDQLKVQGIINEINGLTHDGKPAPGVPVIFGMNFQAVSVGQKLVKDNYDNSCVSDTDPTINQQPGGYLDGSGTPSAVLAYGLQQTDAALASMIAALKAQGLYNSTLFIVTSKHGQSPINPAKVNKPGHFADLVGALPDAGTNPAALAIAGAANCATGPCGFVQDDDIALIWLQGQNISGQQVTNYLNTNAVALFADDVMGGAELTLRFNDPAVDSRTPDIIVQPTYGTIYTHSSAKNAEHGGFSYGDTNVGLIVSNPAFKSTVLKTPVTTAQVAPSILHALGVSPSALKSVKIEKTEVLPALP